MKHIVELMNGVQDKYSVFTNRHTLLISSKGGHLKKVELYMLLVVLINSTLYSLLPLLLHVYTLGC